MHSYIQMLPECLSLFHTSCRLQQLSQRARLLQIIEFFLFLLQQNATVAGCSRFTASLNKPLTPIFTNINSFIVSADAAFASQTSKEIDCSMTQAAVLVYSISQVTHHYFLKKIIPASFCLFSFLCHYNFNTN